MASFLLKSVACLFFVSIFFQKRFGMLMVWISVGCLIMILLSKIHSFVQQSEKRYLLRHQFPLFSIQENYQPSLEDHFERHCQICLDAFQPSDSIVELKCGCQIIYHKECLFQWLEIDMTCPVCKTCMKDLMI